MEGSNGWNQLGAEKLEQVNVDEFELMETRQDTIRLAPFA